MQLTHALTIEQVYTTIRSLHGPVRLLSGYAGECECGARSQLYGIQEPCRQWYEWHLDPTGRRARAIKRGVR